MIELYCFVHILYCLVLSLKNEPVITVIRPRPEPTDPESKTTCGCSRITSTFPRMCCVRFGPLLGPCSVSPPLSSYSYTSCTTLSSLEVNYTLSQQSNIPLHLSYSSSASLRCNDASRVAFHRYLPGSSPELTRTTPLL